MGRFLPPDVDAAVVAVRALKTSAIKKEGNLRSSLRARCATNFCLHKQPTYDIDIIIPINPGIFFSILHEPLLKRSSIA